MSNNNQPDPNPTLPPAQQRLPTPLATKSSRRQKADFAAEVAARNSGEDLPTTRSTTGVDVVWITTADLVNIDPDSLEPTMMSARYGYGHAVTALIKSSLEEVTQLEPVLVTPDRTTGKYYLVDGLSRLKSSIQDRNTQFPATINSKIDLSHYPAPEIGLMVLGHQANTAHNAPTNYDLARNCIDLAERYHMTDLEIGGLLKLGRAKVNRLRNEFGPLIEDPEIDAIIRDNTKVFGNKHANKVREYLRNDMREKAIAFLKAIFTDGGKVSFAKAVAFAEHGELPTESRPAKHKIVLPNSKQEYDPSSRAGTFHIANIDAATFHEISHTLNQLIEKATKAPPSDPS